MMAEIIDLKVERHTTPIVTHADEDGKERKLPLTMPSGEGWIMWAVETEEDGAETAHFIRRTGVKCEG